MWNLYAKVYDVICQNIPYTKMLSAVITETDLRNGFNVLDAGCGTGNFINHAKKITKSIEGIDISKNGIIAIYINAK